MIDKLIKYYKTSPIIRGMAQLLTPVAAADAALTAQLQKIEERKLRIFFDELERGTKELSSELIEEEDFLHAFFATTNAVFRSRRDEKIQFLARLLLGFGTRKSDSEYPIDEFEEYIAILDEMSWREIAILATLAECEQKFSGHNGIMGPGRDAVWPNFTSRIREEQKISEEEVSSVLLRLMRTGFYQPNVGGYGGGSFEGATGKLTASFHKFLNRVKGRNLA